MDTPSFQRLRHLKQLQMAHLTYPNATHTRFAHSLGVFAVMSKVLQNAQRTLQIGDDQVSELRLAALLHDIGHYPYSHLMEKIDKVQLTEDFVQSEGAGAGKKSLDLSSAPSPYPKHEPLGELIVTTRTDLRDALGGPDRAKRIADLFTRSSAADPQLSKLIHSSLDMDRFDFLLRDAKATGVPFGGVDLNYLLSCVKVSPTGIIGFSHKAISAAEQFLFARFFMYKVVYFHKTTFGFEESCRQLLRRCRDEGLHEVPKSGDDIQRWVEGDNFLSFTDAWVDGVILKAMASEHPIIKQLANSIVFRKPPALIREVAELKDLSSGSAEHCRSFLKRCQDRLQDLGTRLDIDPRLFLVTGPSSIKLEDRSPKLTTETARGLEDEQQEELVKIFTPGQDEPRSLVDMPNSIVNVAAAHAYQFARLYLVHDDRQVIEQARQQVAEW
ncbi:MAG: HD domain-containing protein [Deltaproteobacteria bacterium]|nr:HD domain-containing protein [Deltaproteobacteria bacterium]